VAEPRWLVVCDFDGTVTTEDTLVRLVRRYNPDVFGATDAALEDGSLTLNEVLRLEFEPMRVEHDAIVAEAVRASEIREGFPELVHDCRAGGHRVVVVSSGFRSIIDPVLAGAGLHGLELVANDARFSPAGTEVVLRDGGRCGECGEECKRAVVHDLGHDGPVAYVGDGYSDRCAAEAADRAFARRGLARYLRERGIPFTPFEDFHDVRRALFGGDSARPP
jgi:2,3-diketo-5-methylthio-1-phosphopentane phosphatase